MKIKLFNYTKKNLNGNISNYNKPLRNTIKIPDNTIRMKKPELDEKFDKIIKLFIVILDRMADNNKRISMQLKELSKK